MDKRKGEDVRIVREPVDFQVRQQHSFVCGPTSKTWIQPDIVNLEKEQKKSLFQRREQVLMFDSPAK
jgi:hypothetical protein